MVIGTLFVFEVQFISIKEAIIAMKIGLLSVGKTDNKHFARIIEDYTKKINYYLPFEMIYVPDVKNRGRLPTTEIKKAEEEKLLAAMHPSDQVVLLDDKGKQLDSPGFSVYLEKKMISVPKRLLFIVGGPYGFSPGLYNRATDRLSLSPMTFTHEMVRMIFAEQLYRAMTILNNEPYHHE